MRTFARLGLGFFICAGCWEGDPVEPASDAVTEQSAALTFHPHGKGEGQPRRFPCPDDVPAALDPPADVTLVAAFAARGAQIYVCAAPAAASGAGGSAPVWTLKAPHAVLSHGAEMTGIHFAGPTWQANDGSLVTATRLASAALSDAAAIPGLLLQAASHTSKGLFDDVTFIQRLDTVGGAAPATGCDVDHVDAQALVPYRAGYFFYHPAGSAKRVHQCSSKGG